LVRLIRKEQFDVVHVSGGSWQYKGAIAGWLAGIPVLWHLNDSSMPWLFRKLFGVFSRLATGYIYASERTKSYYQPYVKEKRLEVTIPAPVNTRYFDPSLKLPADELDALFVDKKVVGIVANLSPIKGVEIFLRMASSLQGLHDEEIAFVIVGEVFSSQQAYYQSLQTLAENMGICNLYWAGSRKDVRPLLKRFDVYVCSSLAESSPLSVWESMSMANPIVSTDVGDVSLYVKEDRNGFVAPVGDYLLLAEQVESLLVDDEQRKMMGLESRETAIQQLDLGRCAQSHLEAYQRVLSLSIEY